MNVELLSKIAQQGGTIYFTVIFVVAAVWVFLPSNREKFRQAAQIPLNEDDQ